MLWSCFQKALRLDCLVIHDGYFRCLVPSYSNNIEFYLCGPQLTTLFGYFLHKVKAGIYDPLS